MVLDNHLLGVGSQAGEEKETVSGRRLTHTSTGAGFSVCIYGFAALIGKVEIMSDTSQYAHSIVCVAPYTLSKYDLRLLLNVT